MVFNHEPDFTFCIIEGNIAKKLNGKANPNANPNIEIKKTKLSLDPDANSINAAPKIGPVQENDTNTVVSAMKKEPKYPPFDDCLSELFIQELGKAISNNPKKEKAKIINMTKNIKLGIQCVLIIYIASFPNKSVSINPKTAKIGQ